MLQPKWIIYKDLQTNQKIFRLGKVDFHKELLPKTHAQCLGGGKFEINKDTNTIYLYGTSFDFGSVSSEEFTEDLWIQSARLEDMKFMFSNEPLLDNITDWVTLNISKLNFT